MWFRLKEERRARTKFPAVINKTLLLNLCGRHRINTVMVLPWKSLVQQTPGYVCGCSSEEVTWEENMESMLPRHTVLARSVAMCFAHRKPSEVCKFTVLLPASTPSSPGKKWGLSSFPAGHPFPLMQKQREKCTFLKECYGQWKKESLGKWKELNLAESSQIGNILRKEWLPI